MPEHTLGLGLPWRVKEDQKCIHGKHIHIGGNGWTVADVHDFGDGLRKAEFIVRACNAHEDLLAALKAVLDLHERDMAAAREEDYHEGGLTAGVALKVRAAIDKAKEE